MHLYLFSPSFTQVASKLWPANAMKVNAILNNISYLIVVVISKFGWLLLDLHHKKLEMKYRTRIVDFTFAKLPNGRLLAPTLILSQFASKMFKNDKRYDTNEPTN